MPLPADYFITPDSHGFTVSHSHFGALERGIECRARAEDYAHEHAEQAAAAAQYDLPEDLAEAVGSFLHMLDRDGLSRHFEIGIGEDRVESAHLIGLRKAHAAATARAA